MCDTLRSLAQVKISLNVLDSPNELSIDEVIICLIVKKSLIELKKNKKDGQLLNGFHNPFKRSYASNALLVGL